MAKLSEARAALLPIQHLGRLGRFRGKWSGSVILQDDVAWIRFAELTSELQQVLAAIPDISFYTHTKGYWYPLGSRIPRWDLPPHGEEKSLEAALLPSRIETEDAHARMGYSIPFELQRSTQYRPCRLLQCPISALVALTRLEDARVRQWYGIHNDQIAWIYGENLIALDRAQRFWGNDFFYPVGYELVPEWPKEALRSRLEMQPNEWAVWVDNQWEILPNLLEFPLKPELIWEFLNLDDADTNKSTP